MCVCVCVYVVQIHAARLDCAVGSLVWRTHIMHQLELPPQATESDTEGLKNIMVRQTHTHTCTQTRFVWRLQRLRNAGAWQLRVLVYLIGAVIICMTR